jgi:hypothetical protein
MVILGAGWSLLAPTEKGGSGSSTEVSPGQALDRASADPLGDGGAGVEVPAAPDSEQDRSEEYAAARARLEELLAYRSADLKRVKDHNDWVRSVAGRVPPGTQLPDLLQPDPRLLFECDRAIQRFVAAGGSTVELEELRKGIDTENRARNR